MDIQDEERIIKAAVEYLVAENRLFEATLLLNMPLSLYVSREDGGWNQSQSRVYVFDYKAELKVEPGKLNSIRENLTADSKKAIETALKEALSGYQDEYTYVDEVSLQTRLALSDTYPLWRETYQAQLEGDEGPLNQASVGTNTPLFLWNGL